MDFDNSCAASAICPAIRSTMNILHTSSCWVIAGWQNRSDAGCASGARGLRSPAAIGVWCGFNPQGRGTHGSLMCAFGIPGVSNMCFGGCLQDGWPSLLFAASAGHADCIAELIGAGADVNAQAEVRPGHLCFGCVLGANRLASSSTPHGTCSISVLVLAGWQYRACSGITRRSHGLRSPSSPAWRRPETMEFGTPPYSFLFLVPLPCGQHFTTSYDFLVV